MSGLRAVLLGLFCIVVAVRVWVSQQNLDRVMGRGPLDSPLAKDIFDL